jgi:ketosteroid isomerase-like protein
MEVQMKLPVRVAVCLSLLAPTIFTEEQRDKLTPLQQEVWAMEEAYWANLKEGDFESYMDLWHPDFIGWPRPAETTGNKTYIRKIVGDWLRSMQPKSFEYKLRLQAVNDFGNIGIAFYWIDVSWKDLDCTPNGFTNRYIHTWMKQDSKWKIIGGMSADHEAIQ